MFFLINVFYLVIGISRNHVISKMLGSSQSLVYLTLKKGDLIQAKQVIKMFDLKGTNLIMISFLSTLFLRI